MRVSQLARVMAGIGLVALVSRPAAAASIKLTSGADTATAVDNGTTTNVGSAIGNDSNAGTGIITVAGSINGWSVSFTSGTSTSPGGTPLLDLAGFVSCSSGCSPLTIDFSDVGFTAAAGGFTASFAPIMTGNASAVQTAYDDPSNTLFGQAQTIGTIGPFTSNNSGTVTGGGPAGPGAYSVSLVETLTDVSGPVTFSTDSNVATVPEPASLFLMGSGLFGLATYGRKKLFNR
jgi:hypothetical protein